MRKNLSKTQNLQETHQITIDFDVIQKINSIYSILFSWQKESEQRSLESAAETYLNVTQVASITHYSEQTIRTKVMTDDIPSFKMNGRRLFRKSDILSWIASGGK